MPDVTLAQLVAALTWVLSQAVAMGFIDSNQSALALQVASTVLTAAWVIGDAIIRNGRSRALLAPEQPVEKVEGTV
jgi:hypothetical protein